VRTDRITEGAAPEKPGGPAKHLVWEGTIQGACKRSHEITHQSMIETYHSKHRCWWFCDFWGLEGLKKMFRLAITPFTRHILRPFINYAIFDHLCRPTEVDEELWRTERVRGVHERSHCWDLGRRSREKYENWRLHQPRQFEYISLHAEIRTAVLRR